MTGTRYRRRRRRRRPRPRRRRWHHQTPNDIRLLATTNQEIVGFNVLIGTRTRSGTANFPCVHFNYDSADTRRRR